MSELHPRIVESLGEELTWKISAKKGNKKR